jgi:hypothetical protein
MRALRVGYVVMVLVSASLVASCNRTNPDSSGGIGGLRQGLDVGLDSEVPASVASIQIDVSQAGAVVKSDTIAIAPANDGGTHVGPTGDAFFVLQPGTYTVTAQAIDVNGGPSPLCQPATTSAMVAASVTTEVLLKLICRDDTGGLDTSVVVVSVPTITGLTFDPSKFTATCEPVKITVSATDPAGSGLTYAWTIVSGPTSPLDPSTTLASAGKFATFYTSAAGDYTLRVDVTDVNGTSSLSFPIHVIQGSACRPTTAVGPAALPPPPPPVVGCYAYTLNGWQGIPCATDAFIDAHFPHPDVQLTVASSSTAPLVYGQVEVTVPQVASENNVLVGADPSICPSGTTSTPNQWSVQNNTNLFSVPTGTIVDGTDVGGHLSGTQFTIQSDGSTSSVCIWNVDATAQVYSHRQCAPQNPAQRAGGLQAFDQGNIAGFVNTNGTLSIVASFTWVAANLPTTYATVIDDTYKLGSRWSEVSGGLIGIGNCSQAQFTNAEVVTSVAASTCEGDTDATSGICAAPLFEPNASAFVGPIGTIETNNLTNLGAPTVSWPNSDFAVSSVIGTTSGSCLGPSHAYVKDNAQDFGATPSNLGGQAFWESPDLFLVPAGSPVDINAVSTETVITPGGSYDAWVRVHNDLGCSDVTGVKALVYLADPSALSAEWSSITSMQFVGDNMSSTGVTVPAGGQALIGPLNFTAPSSMLGDGHKCMLAAIEGDSESAPANTSDAPDSNQVAQRNLQFFSPCVFPLTNSTSSDGNAQLTLSVTPTTGTVPSLSTLPDVHVAFDDADSSWFNVWSAETGNGTTFAVTHDSGTGTTTVRLGAFSVALDAVSLPAGTTRNATGTANLQTGGSAITLQIAATLTETGGSGTVLVQNGGSCIETPPPQIN